MLSHPSTRVRVTVCAARDQGDVDAIIAGGADGVGVLVQTRHRAEDAVDLSTAVRLLERVPPPVSRYAVTHASDLGQLCQLADSLPIDMLQLHDHVDIETVNRLRHTYPGLRLVKALHVSGSHIENHKEWHNVVDALIVDTLDVATDRIGGTGLVHDWRLTSELIMSSRLPVMLAGGLTPMNVRDAVEATSPWAVNVNSGVEVGGFKDVSLVRSFVEAASSLPVAG